MIPDSASMTFLANDIKISLLKIPPAPDYRRLLREPVRTYRTTIIVRLDEWSNFLCLY